jgi:hypothetical protein
MDVYETSIPPGCCPADEDIAAFLDAAASAGEVACMVAHLARCERCREVVIGVAHFLPEAGDGAASVRGRAARGEISSVTGLRLRIVQLASGGSNVSTAGTASGSARRRRP